MFGTPQKVRRALEQVGSLVNAQLPTGGINARDSFQQMPPQDAIDLVNVVADGFGLIVRQGYQEFAIDLPGAEKVATIMSYYPPTASFSGPNGQVKINQAVGFSLSGNIYACTNLNIYDITAGGAGPWVAQPGVGVVTSDYWTWLNYQNAAGNFIIAANDEGGYVAAGSAGFSGGFSSGFRTANSGFFRVSQGAVPGTIQGIDPDLWCYVMSWKRRLWFIEKFSTRAWYLPVEQITGEAHQWDFGTHFPHGGHLVALANWTLDGGVGIDDMLVAFGSEGDVVIFKGYDPDNAAVDPSAFQLHGVWYIGPLPKGRRSTTAVGGDVYVLSMFGFTQISKLVSGSQIPLGAQKDLSYKIDPLLQKAQRFHKNKDGWFITQLPREELLIVGMPEELANAGVTHLAMQSHEPGMEVSWSRFKDVPFATYTTHDGLIFAGGQNDKSVVGNGKVYLAYSTPLDNVRLDDSVFGQPIRGLVIPAYQTLGPPGMNKQFTMIRPSFLVQQTPALTVAVLTDYVLPGFSNVPALPNQNPGIWDVGVWSNAKWGGLRYPIRRWLGVVGQGFVATAQFDFTAAADTRLMGLDWWVIPGGPL